ncbi:AraC family transcriptional regulator [Marinobacter zhanjiangensis]|uniref:AraC family transcriptional regulator n=1 Tax=Marinobacter zhanjiangensis TaxID=578215 RepID=A0ABQ3B7I0_9GAMM|nr:AraC family transcriptional regulator [Marinobacter zhanjiangensis]GGY78732.1 AraC family transcriptional regulator [Marinobacter zhanjiangensis]
MVPDQQTAQSRIGQVLRFIHSHLDQPLTVASLATLGGWSRWQFQRVFAAHTGSSVAHYIRELRLSQAAELLLCTRDRQLEIALSCGFESDISFSRSFRQYFGCSPGQYRKRGVRCHLRAPIPVAPLPAPPPGSNPCQTRIRVESRPAFDVIGLSCQIHGIYSPTPDFARRVPDLWRQLRTRHILPEKAARLGVMPVSGDAGDHSFPYWACLEASAWQNHPQLPRLTVPAQEYAVVPFQGPVTNLEQTLSWFLDEWLPASGYQGCFGFDLEIYPAGPHRNIPDGHITVEYWVPIRPAGNRTVPMHQMVK